MLHEPIRTSATFTTVSDTSDQDGERRSGRRLRTVFRVARVFGGSQYGLARVLNLSDDGMMLSTKMDVALGDTLSVDLSETRTVTGQVAWHRSERCGLQLLESINSAALLKRLYEEHQEPHSRRLRLPLDKPVVVTTELGLQIARTRDISQSGIKLVHDGRLRPGMTVKVQIAPGIERRGIVRWSLDDVAGCILLESLSVEELGSLTTL